MRAVVLAGGESSRFWPLGGCHKSLLQVAGKPLLVRTIDNIPHDVDEVVVVEPEPGCVSKALGEWKLSREVEFRRQDKPRGMWDAIILGAEDYGDDVLVASGHQFSPFALQRISQGTGTKLLLSKVSNPKGYGVAKVDGDFVVGIEEKPKEPKSDLVVNSLYRLSHKFIIQMASAKGRKGHYFFEKKLSEYLGKNPAEFEVVPKEELPSMKTPWEALSVMERLLESLKGEVRGDVSRDARLEGEVFVEEGASVMAGAHVSGPAYIGRGAMVGTSALVRQTCLEAGSVAGFGSEVARSLVGPGAKLHHSYVGDSVLGRGTWFGFGVITANRRFDKGEISARVKKKEKGTGLGRFGCAVGPGTKVGVGALLMPGVLVGRDVTVGPGTIVDGNVPDGKRVYVVQEKKVK